MEYFSSKTEKEKLLPLELVDVSHSKRHYLACFKCGIVYFEGDTVLHRTGEYFCPHKGFFKTCKYELSGGSEEYFNKNYITK